MKVVILAGGFGTRISEYSHLIPKPMIEVGGFPILHHILNIYSSQGFNDFVIALGYKANVVKNYFDDLYRLSGDVTYDFAAGTVTSNDSRSRNWRITLVDTGLDSMTGGRLLRLRDILGDEAFMLTYGDGLSNVNLSELIHSHVSSGAVATVTGVRPQARFGEMNIEDGVVTSFKEKPQVNSGFVNGGYFVMESAIFNYLSDDATILEGVPMERLAEEGKLNAFLHTGFWQCMDTKRDRDLLDKLALSDPCPWKIV